MAYTLHHSEIIKVDPHLSIEEDIVSPQSSGQLYTYRYQHLKTGVIALVRMADGKFMIEKEYRHPIRKVVYNFPQGSVNEGEDIEHAAKREIYEETGWKVANGIFLTRLYSCPSRIDSINHVYFCDAYQQEEPHRELMEKDEIEVCYVTPEELDELVYKPLVASPEVLYIWETFKHKYYDHTDTVSKPADKHDDMEAFVRQEIADLEATLPSKSGITHTYMEDKIFTLKELLGEWQNAKE